SRAPVGVESKTVLVAIDSTPTGARLVRVRDGAVLGNTPFKESWAAGDGTERLRLEKDGYRPETLVVPMDHGLTFTVELGASPAAAEPTTIAAEPAAPRSKPGRHHHATAAAPSAKPAMPAPAPASAPAAPPR